MTARQIVTETPIGRERIKVDSTPTRILEGLRLARDRRDEFTQLPDGSWMTPSRTNKALRYNTTPEACGCPDSTHGGFRCAHRVAVLALEVVGQECKGQLRSFEHDWRVDRVLRLMVRIQSPSPKWASPRDTEAESIEMVREARLLAGASPLLRETLAGWALARRDMAWEVRL
jgi:hypothetical protein